MIALFVSKLMVMLHTGMPGTLLENTWNVRSGPYRRVYPPDLFGRYSSSMRGLDSSSSRKRNSSRLRNMRM